MPAAIIQHTDYYVYSLLREDGQTPFYIGKGRDDRIDDHEREARREKRKVNHKLNIIRSILSKGSPLQKVILLKNLDRETALAVEIILIQLIGRMPNGPLVNATDGGEGGKGHLPSAETRERMREALRRRDRSVYEKATATRRANGTIIPSEEIKAKIAATLTGRTALPETRAKMSATRTGRRRSAEERAAISRGKMGHSVPEETRERLRQVNLGHHLSEEARAKVSAALRARPPISEETRAKRRASVLARIERIKAEGGTWPPAETIAARQETGQA